MSHDIERLHPDDEEVLDAIKRLPEHPVPHGMEARFLERLASQPVRARRTQGRRRIAWAIAATVLLVVMIGRFRGKQEVSSPLLPVGASPASRLASIQALSGSAFGSEVVARLSRTALYDSSANVRLASIEALGKSTTSEALEPLLKQVIQRDASPFVQAQVVSLVVSFPLDSRRRLEAALLQRQDLDPVLRATLRAVSTS